MRLLPFILLVIVCRALWVMCNTCLCLWFCLLELGVAALFEVGSEHLVLCMAHFGVPLPVLAIVEYIGVEDLDYRFFV